MTRTLIVLLLLLGTGLGAGSAGALRAQETPPQPPPTQPRPDSLDLVFEREAFFYPRYERRNPFRPLTAGDEYGPRFEELELAGILFSPDPERSWALFGLRDAQEGEGVGPQSYRVRRGDSVGNVRVLEIQESRVVVHVEEFGMTEQRILELPRHGQGGF